MNVPIITDINKVPQPASGYIYPFVIYVNDLPILKAKTNSNQIITFDNALWYTVPLDHTTIQELPARVVDIGDRVDSLLALKIGDRLTSLLQGGNIPANLLLRLSAIELRLKLLEDTALVLSLI